MQKPTSNWKSDEPKYAVALGRGTNSVVHVLQQLRILQRTLEIVLHVLEKNEHKNLSYYKSRTQCVQGFADEWTARSLYTKRKQGSANSKEWDDGCSELVSVLQRQIKTFLIDLPSSFPDNTVQLLSAIAREIKHLLDEQDNGNKHAIQTGKALIFRYVSLKKLLHRKRRNSIIQKNKMGYFESGILQEIVSE